MKRKDIENNERKGQNWNWKERPGKEMKRKALKK